IFVVLGAAGLLLHRGAPPTPAAASGHPPVASLYASLIAAEWLLFRLVTAGMKAKGNDWRTLMGRTGSGVSGIARDALLGLLLCAAWVTAVLVVRSSSTDPAGPSLLPRGALETALWIVLSLSAGFCEEITFRGYFQRQFEACTHRPAVALAMQAVLFGIAHAYQGLPSVLAIAGYGVVFGALALWRGSLRPGMVAHALTDLALGLFAR
ncbi:MAG TPA: CPBP family intramembrane glutamic endopeptidase, partial [Vicinamibacteria bacterium]|nr:CPBP family intramembrane glutamic endopeptidase [Vicinamibacteria bacterium]